LKDDDTGLKKILWLSKILHTMRVFFRGGEKGEGRKKIVVSLLE